ncbi:WbuC family cupin fold metalloprotein [Pontiella sulfatireligans]|uniref:Cupin fold metalloprotein WbuC cupin domain-containing protein n=1 Tax=Pontiella sulfatireligans TaxID=2750658 RepID=A0A6C2URA6_9BACT|nr:WbuC family cupin fold metalloprotein [Pontiella sulfatireligans]VGO22483.1 hypothetical protein SCARR_04566 [Pontiella sulfatireligans]
MPETNYPTALFPPANAVVAVDEAMLSQGKAASRESPRGRIIQPLHKQDGDVLQRMLNFIQPGSYIRPHRHRPDRAESIIVVSGTLLYLTFNNDGAVDQALKLKAGSTQFGVDTDGGIWHCFMALEADTVLFEVKPGPYDAAGDKAFAPWAPEEDSPEAEAYLEGLIDGY